MSTHDDAIDLAQRWSTLWNTGGEGTHDLVADEFRIHFGDPGDFGDTDAIEGPAMMADYLRLYTTDRPGIVFRPDEVFPAPQGFSYRWTASVGDREVSGIDMVTVLGGKLTEVWSVTAPRSW